MKDNLSDYKHRVGCFCVPRKVIDDCPDLFCQLVVQFQLFITEAKYNFRTDFFEYVAHSPEFDVVPETGQPKIYNFFISIDDNGEYQAAILQNEPNIEEPTADEVACDASLEG